jgi:hypothetical protein
MNGDDPADVTDDPNDHPASGWGTAAAGVFAHCPARHNPPQQHCAYEPSVGTTTSAGRIDVAPVSVVAPIGAVTLAGVVPDSI